MTNIQIHESESKLREILRMDSVSALVEQVKTIYDDKKTIFHLDSSLDAHGAYLWERVEPTFLINPVTGLNESTIAHELVHALQFKRGFPAIQQIIYSDARSEVVTELNSNIWGGSHSICSILVT